MSLFSSIKKELSSIKKDLSSVKNDLSVVEKIDRALQRFNSESFREHFSANRNEALVIVKSLATILDLDVYTCDESTVYALLNFFAIVHSGEKKGLRDYQIMMQMHEQDPGLIPNKAVAAYDIIAYWLFFFKEPKHVIMKEDLPKLRKTAEFLMDRDYWKGKNQQIQNKYVEDLEYGLVPEKPIFTTGVTAMTKYLSGLKSALGESLTWEHVKSVSGDGVSGPVEMINVKLASGRPYSTVYVSWNGTADPPNKAPVGFTR